MSAERNVLALSCEWYESMKKLSVDIVSLRDVSNWLCRDDVRECISAVVIMYPLDGLMYDMSKGDLGESSDWVR